MNVEKNLVIMLGSGGHTAEMLLLLKNFDFSQYNKTHIITYFINEILNFKF